jgi:hypothetical protein
MGKIQVGVVVANCVLGQMTLLGGGALLVKNLTFLGVCCCIIMGNEGGKKTPVGFGSNQKD